MLDTQQIIEELGIQHLSSSEQEELVSEYYVRLGEAMSVGRTEAQLNEFQAIIDGNQHVIDAWLEQHRPGYEDEDAYKLFLDTATRNNPEGVQPDKMYASAAWIQENIPNIAELMQQVTQEVKALQ